MATLALHLAPKQSRLLAVALLVLAMLAGITLLLAPFLLLQSRRRRIESRFTAASRRRRPS